jgi:hypothetical protein
MNPFKTADPFKANKTGELSDLSKPVLTRSGSVFMWWFMSGFLISSGISLANDHRGSAESSGFLAA